MLLVIPNFWPRSSATRCWPSSRRVCARPTADPENLEPLPAVEHIDPTVFVPRFEAYPQWFVTASTIRPEAPLRLEVTGHDTASADWITSFSTDLLAGVEFPELALDDAGYVVPSTGSDAGEDVADAHAAWLAGGDEPSSDIASFVDDTWSTDRRAADAQRGEAVADAAHVQTRTRS